MDMNSHQVVGQRRRLLGASILVVTIVGCARPIQPSVGAVVQSPSTAERTVFTDSAIFRRVCTQADSGLTLAIGRCTPRDQRVRIPVEIGLSFG
jgi:hypothetical protein